MKLVKIEDSHIDLFTELVEVAKANAVEESNIELNDMCVIILNQLKGGKKR